MVGEQYWQLVAFCGGGVAWVGEVGAHGQGDAGAADIDQATITTRGTVNLLPFVQVLFQVEGAFTAGEANHRCDVGFAVGVVQWAACDHYGVGSQRQRR